MKNGGLPITPIVNTQGHPMHSTQVAFDNEPLVIGLTKREHFAGLAMAAYLANPDCSGKSSTAAYVGVKAVDELLKELEK